ncbi:MAG: hypothetical protein IPO09_15350 [Anaeromyxobacter sp.]|nr:hypothetical protein [Anaeromyxobacter sp.]
MRPLSPPADVAAGLARLDPSPRALRAFALTVGGAPCSWRAGLPGAAAPGGLVFAGAGLLLMAAGLWPRPGCGCCTGLDGAGAGARLAWCRARC